MAMIRPVTGEHIMSYCKLMQNPATDEVWMTAFGKDIGGMCQGDDKTNTIGTNAILVMEPKDDDIGLVESHFNIHVFNTCKTVW